MNFASAKIVCLNKIEFRESIPLPHSIEKTALLLVPSAVEAN